MRRLSAAPYTLGNILNELTQRDIMFSVRRFQYGDAIFDVVKFTPTEFLTAELKIYAGPASGSEDSPESSDALHLMVAREGVVSVLRLEVGWYDLEGAAGDVIQIAKAIEIGINKPS